MKLRLGSTTLGMPTKAASGLVVLITLIGAGFATSASAADFEPTGNKAEALRLGHLAYLAESADPYSALAYERRFAPRQTQGGDLKNVRVKLAKLAADYGLLEAAQASYRRDLTPSVGYEQRNRDWYELAEAWYARGQLNKAQQAFDNIFGAVPEDLKNKLPPFEARLLISQGRNKEAVKLLREWRRKRIRDPFARYNLAVALARAGNQLEGAGELNAVGTLRTSQPDLLALRDQANLVLGFGYLEIGQGATARVLFQRIRLNGPFSDKALLGLGWAEIAPDGERQKHTLVQTIRCIEDPARLLPDNLPVLRRIPREACGPPEEFRDTDRFKAAKGGETEAERYKRALIPWTELARRDPQHNAVAEGLISLPYAYAKLGSSERADEFYANAVGALEPELERLDGAIKQLKRPGASGTALPPAIEADRDWFAQRWGLYTSADAPFFTEALVDQKFRIAAQSLQDLLVLRDQLTTGESRTEALSAELNGRRNALSRAGVTLPRELLEQQQRLTASSKNLTQINSRIDATIDQLNNYLRGKMLASAERHETRLQAYVTNARIGQSNISKVELAKGVEELKP